MKSPSYLALLVFFIYFISLFCCTIVPLQFFLLKPLKNQYQPIKKLTAAACAQVRKLIRQKHHLHLSKWWWLKWATQEKEMNRLQGDSFIKLLWKYRVANKIEESDSEKINQQSRGWLKMMIIELGNSRRRNEQVQGDSIILSFFENTGWPTIIV